MLMHALGLRLHKTLDEIGAMSVGEFYSWLAFFELQAEARS